MSSLRDRIRHNQARRATKADELSWAKDDVKRIGSSYQAVLTTPARLLPATEHVQTWAYVPNEPYPPPRGIVWQRRLDADSRDKSEVLDTPRVVSWPGYEYKRGRWNYVRRQKKVDVYGHFEFLLLAAVRHHCHKKRLRSKNAGLQG